jgi:hypothetical protein
MQEHMFTHLFLGEVLLIPRDMDGQAINLVPDGCILGTSHTAKVLAMLLLLLLLLLLGCREDGRG